MSNEKPKDPQNPREPGPAEEGGRLDETRTRILKEKLQQDDPEALQEKPPSQ